MENADDLHENEIPPTRTTEKIWDMGTTLSSPITEKTTSFIENDKYHVGVSCMQGWRVTMEDSHTVSLRMNGDSNATFFGVYDGHGGSSVAKFAGDHLENYITSQESYKTGDIPKAIERGFIDIDSAMRENNELVNEMSGSTAVTVLVKDNVLYCGNAGDSRAIAYVGNKTIPLSFDHKPNNPEEKKRICNAGGWVEVNRVNGILAVSRALGDFVFKTDGNKRPEEQAVTALPEVSKHDLSVDWKFVVLACDGIWDVMTSDEVGNFVQDRLMAGARPDTICEELMMNCLSPDVSENQAGCDNMSVVIAKFVSPADAVKRDSSFDRESVETTATQ